MQTGNGSGGEPEEFAEVWARNLDQTFAKIRDVVQKYPYVAMVMHPISKAANILAVACMNPSEKGGGRLGRG